MIGQLLGANQSALLNLEILKYARSILYEILRENVFLRPCRNVFLSFIAILRAKNCSSDEGLR
jgi:hypothetical protein